jgi:Kelch motif
VVAIVTAGLLVGAAAPAAADVGYWTTTGSLNVARASLGGIVLSDGDVLAAGGVETAASTVTKTAELYDPSTGTWTMTGSMHYARATQQLIKLSNGRILTGAGAELASFGAGTAIYGKTAETYDPSTGEWTEVGSLHVKRAEFFQVLLDTGNSMICGGFTANTEVMTNTCEVFDPDTNEWSFTGELPGSDGKPSPNGFGLANGPLFSFSSGPDKGDVMFAGGLVNGTIPVKQSELYDPATGEWALTGSMNEARAGFRTTLLTDGEVLASGGVHTGGSVPEITNTAELYDPDTGTWTLTGSMHHERTRHTATVLADGTVLVTGGRLSGATIPEDTAEIYDPATGTWTEAPDMPAPLSNSQSQMLSTGQVLVFGGFGLGLIPQKHAFVYNGPSLSTAHVGFGELVVARVSSARRIMFTNRGPRRLRLQARLGGNSPRQFMLGADGCNKTLEPGQKCTMNVCLAPRVVGRFAARLLVRVQGRVTLWTGIQGRGLRSSHPLTAATVRRCVLPRQH